MFEPIPGPLPPQFDLPGVRVEGPSATGKWIAVDENDYIVCGWDHQLQEWRAGTSGVPFKITRVEW